MRGEGEMCIKKEQTNKVVIPDDDFEECIGKCSDCRYFAPNSGENGWCDYHMKDTDAKNYCGYFDEPADISEFFDIEDSPGLKDWNFDDLNQEEL